MRRGAALLTLVAACSAPGDPTYPDRTIIGPPPAVGDACEPPFPVNFAQDWFVFADLDRGVSCDVFLEQDECAIGIYHDCTDMSSNPREWQGVVDSDEAQPTTYVPVMSITAKYDDPTSGGRIARGPTCCSGGLYPRGDNEPPTYALLTCHDTTCGSLFNRFHTGLYLERKNDLDPARLLGQPITFEAGAMAPDAVFVGEGLWTIVQPNLYLYLPETADALRVNVDVGIAEHIAASLDETAVFVAGTSLVRVDVGPRMESVRTALPGRADAIAVTLEGIVVAYESNGVSVLGRYDATTLAPLGSPVTQTVRISGLAPLDRPAGLAVATVEGSSKIYAVTSTLTMGELLDLRTAAGLELGAIVPVAPFLVDGDNVGMISECYATAPTRHCYFEIDTSEAKVERVGIPDVAHLERAAYDVNTNRIVLSSSDGIVTFIDRGQAFRPRVQDRVNTTMLRLGAVAIDSANRRAYVVQSVDGAVRPILQPD